MLRVTVATTRLADSAQTELQTAGRMRGAVVPASLVLRSLVEVLASALKSGSPAEGVCWLDLLPCVSDRL